MKIVKYKSGHQQHFERINRAWVEKYFRIEPMDEALLTNPEENILKKGGHIYFVEYQNQIIGTVALLLIDNGVYEMAKMAVDEAFRGIGAGKFLCQSAIEEAKKLNAEKLVLFTNSKLKKAIGIYHQFGFQDVALDGQEYSRADTRMELLLKSEPAVKWFDRKFDFNFESDQFQNLLERLNNTVFQVSEIIQEIPEQTLNYKPNGKWSIKEQIGHLWIIEPLWQKRFLEIKENKTAMSSADLNNIATDQAFFNQYDIKKIVSDFQQERENTIQMLKSFTGEDFNQKSFHPRLNHPMRIVDLMYFVAEHDEHHLNAILRICNKKAFV